MSADIEYVNTCASLIHQSSDPCRIMDVLQRLQSVQMTIATLKATRIGVIINKLAGDNKMPSNVRTLAFNIVKQWKEIANSAVQQQNNRPSTPTPPPPTTTTITSQRGRKRTVSQMEQSSHQSTPYDSHKRKRMAGRGSPAVRKNKVPKLQSICIRQMAKNPIAIGRIPCELDSSLCLSIYGSLKPSELKKVYKVFIHRTGSILHSEQRVH